MNEIITIGIPAFNEEAYIAETIRSVLNQEMANWKLIISDNCSEDNTYKLAKEYSLNDKRIVLHRQKRKISILENFLFVLKECRSKYFAWLGAHDIFERNYINHAVSVLERNEKISMVYPKSIVIDKDGIQIQTADSDIDSTGLCRYQRMCKVAKNLNCCTAIHGVFRSELLMKVPFRNIIGSDHLIIFSISSYGDLHEMPILGIKRRKIRDENFEQQKKRWLKEDLFSPGRHINSFSPLLKEYLLFIANSDHIIFREKFFLFYELVKIFRRRFKVPVKDIFQLFFKK